MRGKAPASRRLCRSGPTISTREHGGVFDKLNKWRDSRVKPPSARQADRRYARHRDRGGAEKVGCSGKSYGADTMARLPESPPAGGPPGSGAQSVRRDSCPGYDARKTPASMA